MKFILIPLARAALIALMAIASVNAFIIGAVAQLIWDGKISLIINVFVYAGLLVRKANGKVGFSWKMDFSQELNIGPNDDLLSRLFVKPVTYIWAGTGNRFSDYVYANPIDYILNRPVSKTRKPCTRS